MNKTQNLLGVAAIALMLAFGALILQTDALFLRLLLGVGLGYALTRSFLGFAGSVNRAYNGGSTRLMIVLMVMFVVTAIINAGFLYNSDLSQYDLWINPINWGLMIGGLMFGFGMTFSSCCASGVMTDLVTDLPRAGTTLIFFAMGVYLGFPLQSQLPLISETVVSTSSYAGQGVFMPDLFGSGLMGYLGAILLTVVFAAIVVYLAKIYENKRRNSGTFYGIESELEQDKVAQAGKGVVVQPFVLFSKQTYQKLFVTPWSMKAGAAMIVVIFTLMLATTQSGWGASTPFGIWFGKAIMLLGASADSVASFADRPVAMFTSPFLEHQITVQNIGIVFGTLICVLLAGQFTFKCSYSAKQLMLFAMGGLFMGLGTRFANGCNVGALYTPIANLSLSGWIFLVFLVAGGVLGNKAANRT
ncbi:YeeE/YedE family protein [Psychromonas marina]|nr:YeeE/YedE family protein [Psychromonas marina]